MHTYSTGVPEVLSVLLPYGRHAPYLCQVEKMNEEYGTDPKDIYSAIGPSICQKCYEVSEDVILEFQKSFEKKYWDSLFYIKENGKCSSTIFFFFP